MKKLVALFLVLCLMFSVLPSGVLAEEGNFSSDTEESVTDPIPTTEMQNDEIVTNSSEPSLYLRYPEKICIKEAQRGETRVEVGVTVLHRDAALENLTVETSNDNTILITDVFYIPYSVPCFDIMLKPIGIGTVTLTITFDNGDITLTKTCDIEVYAAFSDGDWEFDITKNNDNDDEAIIVGYTGSESDVRIPEVVSLDEKTYPVIYIGSYAFQDNTSFVNVAIPGSVEMGLNVFYGAKNLEVITFEEGFEVAELIENCPELHTINFPSTIMGIGRDPGIINCPKMLTITVAENNPRFKAIDGVLYCLGEFGRDGPYEWILFYYPSALPATEFTIPDNIKHIGYYAFSYAQNLSKLVLNDEIVSSLSHKFDRYSSIVEFEVAAGNERYFNDDDGVLYEKSGYEYWNSEIEILECGLLAKYPAGKTNTACTIPDEIDGNIIMGICENAFAEQKYLQTLTLPKTLNSIMCNLAGFDRSNISAVNIVGDPQIEENIFSGAGKLSTINVSNSTKYSSVDGVLFNFDKTKLVAYPTIKTASSYTIPNSVKTIGVGGFYKETKYCLLDEVARYSPGKIIIPNGVTTIEQAAFGGLAIEEITFPATVTNMAGSVFWDCRNLEKVVFLGDIPYFDTSVFDNCSYGIQLTVYCLPTATNIINTIEMINEYRENNNYGEKTIQIKALPPSIPPPKPILVTKITISKVGLTRYTDTTLALTATVSPATATNKDVIWTTNKIDIATVDESGLVTFIAPGKVTIKATAADGSKKSASVTFTVKQLVANLSLNYSEFELIRTKKLTLKATAMPVNATLKTVTWSSSDKTIATVSSKGVVTAKKAGEVTITAKAKDGSAETATCTITVIPIYETSVKLSKTSLKLEQGKSATLKATLTPKVNDYKTVVWASSDPEIATVDSKGKVVAKSRGTCTITATTKGKELVATCAVTVDKSTLSTAELKVISEKLSYLGPTIAFPGTPSKINMMQYLCTYYENDVGDDRLDGYIDSDDYDVNPDYGYISTTKANEIIKSVFGMDIPDLNGTFAGFKDIFYNKDRIYYSDDKFFIQMADPEYFVWKYKLLTYKYLGNDTFSIGMGYYFYGKKAPTTANATVILKRTDNSWGYIVESFPKNSWGGVGAW